MAQNATDISPADSLSREFRFPYSQDAEQAVVGALLQNPRALTRVFEVLERDHFFLQAHRLIFDSVARLTREGKAVDYVLVMEDLKSQGNLELAGGAAYLTELTRVVPSPEHAHHYARVVAEKHMLRQLVQAALDMGRDASDESSDVSQVINRAGDMILALQEEHGGRTFQPVKDLLEPTWKQIQDRNLGVLKFIRTHFPSIDNILGGMMASDVVVLAARPGMGKTSLALNIALNVARLGHKDYKDDKPKNVLIFSMEMNATQICQRLIAIEGRLDSQKLRLGDLKEPEWVALTDACERLRELNLYIDDSPGLTPVELHGKAQQLKMEHGLDLIIVDYLQLMESGMHRRGGERFQEVADISRALKALSRRLKVPVIALSQLSREIEKRPGSRPKLSDLRESGAIEQDADVVMFITENEKHRREQVRLAAQLKREQERDTSEDPERKGKARRSYQEGLEEKVYMETERDYQKKTRDLEIHVEKNRHGPTGVATLRFVPSRTLFGEVKFMDSQGYSVGE